MAPFSGTLNILCRIIIRIQKGTIILTTTHILTSIEGLCRGPPQGVIWQGSVGFSKALGFGLLSEILAFFGYSLYYGT